MIHDRKLVEQLSLLPTRSFAGDVYRAVRKSQEPLAPSSKGGRWITSGNAYVLYTSLERDGALAEISFHWSQLTPAPTKPAALYKIRATASQSLTLVEADLTKLGVDMNQYKTVNYQRTQEIGAAVSFLGYDGLIVPSARWNCENAVLLMDNRDASCELAVTEDSEVDWRAWAKAHGFL